MSKSLKLIIPQYDAVEIVFIPQEALMGGKNTGLDAWFGCIPCGGKFDWLPDKGYMVCNLCGCDVSRSECVALIEGYRAELEKLVLMVVPKKTKRSLLDVILRRNR